MTLTNHISSEVAKILTLSVGFCLFLNLTSFAQGERERNDMPKNTDTMGQFESPESAAMEMKNENYFRSTTTVKNNPTPINNNQVRKDNPIYKQGGEKDTKKEGMSTLSFNLFLYIVDKFKED